MKASDLFEGIGILAKYDGLELKKAGDPANRLRFSTVQFAGDDADKLKDLGFVEDTVDGTSWYTDT